MAIIGTCIANHKRGNHIIVSMLEHPSIYKMCDYLARRMQKGTASTEISKMDAIMGTEIEEDGDYLVNEKDKFIVFTEQGVK